MASGLPLVVVAFTLSVVLVQFVSAGERDCQSYRDITGTYHSSEKCYSGFCCGTCNSRHCCTNSFMRLTEDKQDECEYNGGDSPVSMIFGIISFVVFLLIIICCCVCPCCCLYKMCRKPTPVIATTTHTTVVTSAPQQYPQQPTAAPVPHQPYQGPQYQPMPVQPGYGAQPMPVQPGYGAQPMPSKPYQGQPYTPGPPPTYQEAIGPVYPPQPMPYSQAGFNPGQPPYPLQPPAQAQANAPMAGPDFLAQPAYNPDYVAPPPKMG